MRRKISILPVLLFILPQLLNAGQAQDPVTPEMPSFLLDEQVAGLCYSAFRAGQHPPLPGVEAVNPSDEEIHEDFNILLRDTPFRLIRLYDSGANATTVLRVIEKHDLPIKVLLGAWLAAEVSNPACSWHPEPYPEEELAANKLFNASEVGRAIRLALDYPDIVVAVSVGNEALVSWTDHLVPVESVKQYVRTVKAAIDQPVTIADTFDFWEGHGQELAGELDFVSVHIYPLWFGRDIDEGLKFVIESLESVRAALPNAKVVITETGWATTGTEFGARASEEKQRRFYHELLTWAREAKITNFFFSAFDESWKGDPANAAGAEKHWGLYLEDRTPKLTIKTLSPDERKSEN